MSAAEKRAERVFNGELENLTDVTDFVKFIIARHYGIPFFDPYFDKRTFDELIFEAKLINLQVTPVEKRASDMLNKNKEEAAEMFDDMEEDEWREVQPISNDPIIDSFMKTGKFQGEK